MHHVVKRFHNLAFDCGVYPNICHANATCKATHDNRKNFNKCACNDGFVGNGIECFMEPESCNTVCCDEHSEKYLIDHCNCKNISYNCCPCNVLTISSQCGASTIFSNDISGYYTNSETDKNGLSIFKKETSTNSPSVYCHYNQFEQVLIYKVTKSF